MQGARSDRSARHHRSAKPSLATSIRSASTTRCSRRRGHERAAARSDQGIGRRAETDCPPRHLTARPRKQPRKERTPAMPTSWWDFACRARCAACAAARNADSDDRLPSAEDARGLRLRVCHRRSACLAFVVQILCSSRRVVLRNDAYDAQRGSIVQIPSQNPKMGRRRIGKLGINDYDVGSRNCNFMRRRIEKKCLHRLQNLAKGR